MIDGFNIERFRQIRPVKNTNISTRLAVLPVASDSLKEHGIFKGDLLVIKFTNQANLDQLCVFRTSEGLTVDFYDHQPLELVGVAVRVERDLV
jgi:SOS-response transcriptional repressor LexA